MAASASGAFALALTAALALAFSISATARSDEAHLVFRLSEGTPGRILKFEFCRKGTCDRAQRERWSTHYLVPPPGEVCRLSDVGEALKWIEQNRPGWLLAGWGCVSARKQSA